MDLSGEVINNTYIIKSLITKSNFAQRWEAKAIYSPNTFYFDLILGEKYNQNLIKNKSKLSEKLVNLREIQNPHILKTIEYGEYKNQLYSVQQKISGISLSEESNYTTANILRIMKTFALCLMDIEAKGLSHNLLSMQSIWVPQGNEMGSLFIGDLLLFDLLSLADGNIGSHLSIPEPYINFNSYSENVYRSDYRNDLYSFGAIFYKLVSKVAPYKADSYEVMEKLQKKGSVDISSISNQNIVDFIYPLLTSRSKYPSVRDMYEDFQELFENQISMKTIDDIRMYTSAEESIYSSNVKIDNQVIDELETISEVVSTGKNEPDKENKVKSILNKIKTIFGFITRYRKRSNRIKKIKKTGFGSKHIKSNLETPTGEMGYKNITSDKKRLLNIFSKLASHFSDMNMDKRKNIVFPIITKKKDPFTNEKSSPFSKKIDGRFKQGINDFNDFKKNDIASELSKGNNNQVFYFRSRDGLDIKRDQINEDQDRSVKTLNDNSEKHISLNERDNSQTAIMEEKNACFEEFENQGFTSDKIQDERPLPENKTDHANTVYVIKKSLWLRFWMFLKKIFKFYKQTICNIFCKK
ncbi:hypothetical protein [Oceanispirochaeta sp. M1]|nr:hypothetical protein [Oceanispirochaeta sp. M1]